MDTQSDHRLIDKALDWTRSGDTPFFLYIHLMNPHSPYTSSRIDGVVRAVGTIISPSVKTSMTRDEIEDIIARYDGGLRSATTEASRLLGSIRESTRPFVFVLTADHGESLGEGGRWSHATALAPELLYVPLLVLGQGVAPGRVNDAVGHQSLSKTLLAAAGLACDQCFGGDLRTSRGDETIEGYVPPDQWYRLRAGYLGISDQRTGTTRIYNFKDDPLMAKDLAETLRGLALDLTTNLDWTQPALKPLRAYELETLRSFGYIGGRPSRAK